MKGFVGHHTINNTHVLSLRLSHVLNPFIFGVNSCQLQIDNYSHVKPNCNQNIDVCLLNNNE